MDGNAEMTMKTVMAKMKNLIMSLAVRIRMTTMKAMRLAMMKRRVNKKRAETLMKIIVIRLAGKPTPT